MKKLLTGLFILILACTGYTQEFEINQDCVYLNDLLEGDYPSIGIQCGFKPGDRKILPASVIANTLKRSALPVIDMPANFTIIRSGYKLDEEMLRQELETIYTDEHPDKNITVEFVRFGRDVYLAPGAEYELKADLSKFGTGTGTLSTEGMKATFSYTVKVFEEGYVTSDRVRPGEELASKTNKEIIDITNLRSPLVRDVASVVAKRSLTKGRPITEDMVEDRPDRVKGDTIRLIYSSGDIKIESSVIAETNAMVGKTFLVKNPVSGKVFTAIYRGNGIAEVY